MPDMGIELQRRSAGTSDNNDDEQQQQQQQDALGAQQEGRPPEEELEEEKTGWDQFWSRLNQARALAGKIVNQNDVQLVIVLLIAINAIMMGVGTFDFISENPARQYTFEVVDQVFLIIFTVELAFQTFYRGLTLFLDGWLVFDFVIIVVSWSFSSVQIIRAFRIFRALRLVTRIKVMKNLVLAVFGVMPRMAAIGLLLFLIFYIFAVMFTQLFKNLYKEGKTDQDYFSRLDATFFTLFQMMTLDAWADIARQVINEIKWAWLPFLVFVTISGFIVVNLIIAVICDAISALHEDEKAKIHGTYDEGNSYSDETSEMDIQEQLQSLEHQVNELSRVQEQTMHTLEYLTRHLQMKQLTQDGGSSGGDGGGGNSSTLPNGGTLP